MQIIVDGKVAIMKKGSSFDYIAENRYFTGSDSYTLTITFPLRDCKQNRAIFGHINRSDVDKDKVVFDCEIWDRNFFKSGSITITELTDEEVKTQFLEGRSEQNYDNTFDDIYINELDLGSPDDMSITNAPATQWGSYDAGKNWVSLPWVNNSSGNIQNNVDYSNGSYSWHSVADDDEDTDVTSGLSCQPYLLYIVKKMCEALGYTIDVSEWEASNLRHLIICNVLPYVWSMPEFYHILPHWTVMEFFEKLEDFLNADFEINHKTKHIVFAFSMPSIRNAEPVSIKKVVDEYDVTITEEDESNYTESANFKYSECDHEMFKYYSCYWFIKEMKDDIKVYDTLDELLSMKSSWAKADSYGRGSDINKLLYCKDVDTYFVIRCIENELAGSFTVAGHTNYSYYRICIPEPVNQFGERVIEEDNENTFELDIVPAWIDETDKTKGKCIFVEMSSYDTSGDSATSLDQLRELFNDENYLLQPFPVQWLAQGEKDRNSSYFDKLYVAFWDGTNYFPGYLPCPIIDRVTITNGWQKIITPYSIRLNSNTATDIRQAIYKIEPRQKYTFKFLSNTIPNPRAMFYINNKRYVCEKITATFSENGKSQLLKGEFYKVID